MKKIVILGTGGNCNDIVDTINEINLKAGKKKYECVGFLDDNKKFHGKKFMGLKVMGSLDIVSEFGEDIFFVNGIGSSRTFLFKEKIIKKTGIPRDSFETIVHPSASISKTAEIGRGVVILQNVTISTNVKIRDHVIILPNAVISHDDIIGDYSIVTGGVCISGNVKIGRSVYLGTNASIIENITIGDHSLVGMGSVVIKNVAPYTVVAGNPAKVLRKIEEN